MADVSSNSKGNGGWEGNPRKKLKFSFLTVEKGSQDEDNLQNESRKLFKKCEGGGSENEDDRMQTEDLTFENFPLEEDEKLLGDSGIDLHLYSCKDNPEDKRKFEIRRVRCGQRPSEGEGTSQNEGLKSFAVTELSTPVKHSQCRGETPETSEPDKVYQGGELPFGLAISDAVEDPESLQTPRDDVAKKTPDRSLFKKVHEKLLYECNLTPKKVKKKSLELNMDF